MVGVILVLIVEGIEKNEVHQYQSKLVADQNNTSSATANNSNIQEEAMIGSRIYLSVKK